MNQWTPEIGEILKTRLKPENDVDRFPVAAEKKVKQLNFETKEIQVILKKLYSISYVRTMEISIKLKFKGKGSTQAMGKGSKCNVLYSSQEKKST